ncbi:hypothetical protein AeNC1_014815, partial [Aphanomyces euteiches]
MLCLPSKNDPIVQVDSYDASMVRLLSLFAIAAVDSNDNATYAPAMMYEARAGLEDPNALFTASNKQQALAPPRNLDASVASLPIPTNRWWGNLISTGKDAKEVLRVWTNPYAIAPLITGLQISYPAATRVFGGSSGNGNANRYYL